MSKSYILLKNGIELSVNLNKKEKEEYINICLEIWGAIPKDVNWAMNTKLYKDHKNANFRT